MFNRGMNRAGAKAPLLVRRLVRFGSLSTCARTQTARPLRANTAGARLTSHNINGGGRRAVQCKTGGGGRRRVTAGGTSATVAGGRYA